MNSQAYMGVFAKDLLLVNFIEIVTLGILTDGNCLYNAASMHLDGKLGIRA